MTLTEFLLARIAEDEDVARSLRGYEVVALGNAIAEFDDEFGSTAVHHFTKWDPARVLAECEAKRRIVELHRSTLGSQVHKNGRWDADAGVMVACRYWWCGVCDADRDYGYTGGPEEGCETLRLLSMPYADHPDFDPAWR